MTSKDRVLAAFAHERPDRVPLWYGASSGLTRKLCDALGTADEEELERRLRTDFRRIRQRYVGPPLATLPNGNSVSFWGVERGGLEYGQPLSHPLAGAQSPRDLDRHSWPDPAWFTSRDCPSRAEAWKDYAVIGGPWVVVWSDATELMGMSEYFMRMHSDPDLIHALNERIADFYWKLCVEFFDRCAKQIDVFFFGDDFGTQEALFVSPEMWRVFFKPIVKRFSDLGHDYGMRTMFHSCGSVWEIVPDLVEIGLDALNPVQPRARGMDLAGLKERYGSRLAFHGAVDHQELLPFARPEEVRREVRRVIDILAPGGGYCLAASHDLMLEDFPVENVIAMYEEGFAYGSRFYSQNRP
jgi:uroporphyrinogen decarboxylase